MHRRGGFFLTQEFCILSQKHLNWPAEVNANSWRWESSGNFFMHISYAWTRITLPANWTEPWWLRAPREDDPGSTEQRGSAWSSVTEPHSTTSPCCIYLGRSKVSQIQEARTWTQALNGNTLKKFVPCFQATIVFVLFYAFFHFPVCYL